MADETSRQLRALIEQDLTAKQAMLQDEILLAQAGALAEHMVTALQAGGKILFFGNGGSAADATHLAAELVGKFERIPPYLPAMNLSVISTESM